MPSGQEGRQSLDGLIKDRSLLRSQGRGHGGRMQETLGGHQAHVPSLPTVSPQRLEGIDGLTWADVTRSRGCWSNAPSAA